jgi:glycosyltransferase involved in cell wall biosynthesis
VRVCYFGTYRTAYSRNEIMIEGLRRAGVEVVECQVPLWTGIEDRVDAALGGWTRAEFLKRALATYRRLLAAVRRVGDFDVMMLGYPGQIDAYPARLLAWKRRKPLVLDVFMSIYLIALERELVASSPATGRLIWWMENVACRLPDHLIIDTAEYVDWFGETYGLDASRFGLVPTGADDRIYRPVEAPDQPPDGPFRVVYYGTYIPLHGVEYMIRAAALLTEHEDIEFEMIGTGPEQEKALALAQELALTNIHFAGWVDKHDLPARVASADVCLGVFGTSEQSTRTIQNKIYEGMAMGKPVITGDSPTVNHALEHARHAYLIPRGDAAALAQAVLHLKGDPALRARLSAEGCAHFQACFTPDVLGRQTRAILEGVVARTARR